MYPADRLRRADGRLMAEFPAPQWFYALGRLMEAEGESFRRLGYAEVRFIVAVLDANGRHLHDTAIEIDGYALTRAAPLDDAAGFDADFTICASDAVWHRMLDEIARDGRPALRHTLSSLALVGEELWLESSDQLREDKFYRFNQTLQDLLNLSRKFSQ
jgi:hypothetical protein